MCSTGKYSLIHFYKTNNIKGRVEIQALPFPFVCPHIVCGDYSRLLFATAKMSDYVTTGIICITERIYEHGIPVRYLQQSEVMLGGILH
jgi:rRNA-processing protein FCF1